MSEKYIIPTPGDVVAGKYHIERELGRGAYGVVFRARQEGIGRHVALKTLLPKAFLESDIVERFEREAQFVGRLNHPNIVRVHDYGRHENLLYMAVEYVEGPTLEDIIATKAPLEPERVRRLVYQLIDALEHAHERSIVHRDLKPANIVLLQQDGGDVPEVVKVLDFGIAKLLHAEEEDHNTLTQAGTVLGTPHYMSPETIVGDAIDHRADIYSLGVMMYEMLTGSRPFGAKNSPGIMVKHLRDTPPELPAHLEGSCWGEAVRRCMAKRPEKRLQAATEVRGILERRDEGKRTALDGGATTAQSAMASADGRKKSTIAAVAAGIVMALSIAGAAHWLWPSEQDASPQAQVAGTEAAPSDEPARSAESPGQPEAPPKAARLPDGDVDESLDFAPEEVAAPAADAGRPDVGRGELAADASAHAQGATQRPDAAADKGSAASARAAGPSRREPTESRRPKTRPSTRERSGSSARADKGSRKSQPKSAKVNLTVEASPPNARVVLDGQPMGSAPVTHRLTKSDTPITVEVSHIGYRTKYETVVPDQDRSVRVELQKGRLKLIP